MKCPVCRAEQDWSDACRRCKCDLRLLRAVAEASQAQRLRCLALLNESRWDAALQTARHAHSLLPDADTRRLVAVCRLLSGDWPAALRSARSA